MPDHTAPIAPLRILITPSHYLPGYKGGGPIRAVANLVAALGDHFDFRIVTADRDFGDPAPYPNQAPGQWHACGKAQVLYLPPAQLSLAPWARRLAQMQVDLIYLVGLFVAPTRHTLLLRRLGSIPRLPVLLAPHGELSPRALAQKARKKQLYLRLLLRFGCCDDVFWHATNERDPQEFEQALGRWLPGMAGSIGLAANLLDPASRPPAAGVGAPKQAGALRVIFLSRIAHNKNLAFALDSLRGSDRQVHCDIYGPIEEGDYWRRCQRIMAHLPANIRVAYCGLVAPVQVARVLQDYHLFYLPTQGENFGYAIVEAWAAGLPVLISDQTPWRALESRGIGWDLPLAEPAGFSAVLRRVADMEQAEFSAWSRRAQRFAGDLLARQNASALPAYRALFEQTLRHAQRQPAHRPPAR